VLPLRETGTGTPPGTAAIEVLLRFARAGHRAGYPTADLEERLLALAAYLGVEGAEVSATPTLIELSFGAFPEQRNFSLRVHPMPVDLDAIARLDEVVQDVMEEKLEAEGALAAVADVEAHPLRRRWPVILAAYGVAGAALTPLLGGAWREAVAGGAVGLLVGAIVLVTQRRARAEPMVAPVAAIAASFAAAALVELGIRASADIVTLAALVTLLPGMRLTIGMRELSTDHLQSGVANMASALVQLLGLVFGVGIGRSIALAWFGPPEQLTPDFGFDTANVAAAVAAALAFTITLRAQYRDAWLMCFAALLALFANTAGKEVVGTQAAVFGAALAVGLVGGLAGARLRRSPLVFLVPGVLILVPGSAGFNSALQLLTNQTVSGVTTAFDTFVTAMSIAYGLMVANIVAPRTFTGEERR
jgi:uncharacterized membrane protein YjjP (DUF1212 family)